MKRLSGTWLKSLTAFACLICATTMTQPANANDDGASPEDVIKQFVEHLDSLSLDSAALTEVKSMIDELREDEYMKMEAVTSALAKIYPEYNQALLATQTDNPNDAIEKLSPLAQSEDKYLAADASFFLARTLMNDQRYEEALPILERMTEELTDFSLHSGAAVYFTGLAQVNLLENQRAVKSFARFLDDYENAPERLRVAAWRQIQNIQAFEEGGMTDVLQRMDFSRRRLEIENTDESTQEQQNKIVGMLAKLIKEQEKKECSKCSSKKNCEGQQQQEAKGQGNGEGEGEGKSNAGGTSNNPDGVVRRTYDDGPASPWSHLRDRIRDPSNKAIKDRLPARYRAVVERYYDKISGDDE